MIKVLEFKKIAFACVLALGACLITVVPASANTIDWVTWNPTTFTIGNPSGGAESGTTTSGVTVSYSGELDYFYSGYPTYSPSSTFSGGTVGNAPPGGIIQLVGGHNGVNTITFSQAVVDPVMAIWSLGQGGGPASFVFTSSEPFSIQSGGPSLEYGGGSITQSGNTVNGTEGNGTIQFTGTYTQLSWTNPEAEYWYGFTAGITGVAPTATPEPATYMSLLLGLGLLGLVTRGKLCRAL
jgi:hypothetical protein